MAALRPTITMKQVFDGSLTIKSILVPFQILEFGEKNENRLPWQPLNVLSNKRSSKQWMDKTKKLVVTDHDRRHGKEPLICDLQNSNVTKESIKTPLSMFNKAPKIEDLVELRNEPCQWEKRSLQTAELITSSILKIKNNRKFFRKTLKTWQCSLLCRLQAMSSWTTARLIQCDYYRLRKTSLNNSSSGIISHIFKYKSIFRKKNWIKQYELVRRYSRPWTVDWKFNWFNPTTVNVKPNNECRK